MALGKGKKKHVAPFLTASWPWKALPFKPVPSQQAPKSSLALFVPAVIWSCTPPCHSPTANITILPCSLLVHMTSIPSYTLCPSLPVPFASPWRWRWHGPPKHCYLTTLLHGVTTQKTMTWIFIAIKISSLCVGQDHPVARIWTSVQYFITVHTYT